MQVFRQSLKKCLLAKILLSMAIWGVIATVFCSYFSRQFTIPLVMAVIWYAVIIVVGRKLNYVCVADDRLIVRHVLSRMWSKEYFYRDIEEIGIFTGSMDYLQIKSPRRSMRPIRHDIARVSPDDYAGLVQALQSHGVKLKAL